MKIAAIVLALTALSACAESLEDAEPPAASHCDELNQKRLCQSLLGADVANPRTPRRMSI